MRKYITMFTMLLAAGSVAAQQDCGKLDGVPIPCWRDFLDGEGDASLPFYPYAKRENGCSIPGGAPGAYDNFASYGYDFSFRSACNKHDRCYYRLGSSGWDCNGGFTADLQQVCADGMFQPLTWEDLVPPIGSLRLNAVAACEARAVIVAGSVTGTGFIYHTAAQEAQRKYLDMVNAYMGVRAMPAVVQYILK